MSGIGRRYEADPRRREEIERDWAQVMAAQPPSQKKPPPQPAPPQTTSGNQFAASAPFQALTAAYQVYQANNDGTASSLGKRSTPASTPTKRRPYRRTKRPKDYNDRSTITTTTKTAETPVNPYDVVLGEAQDLMQAAYEAQALGRLKMASNYLLLVHTRLVGLGKKFDWVQRFQGREHLMSAQKGSQEHAATDTAEHHGGLKPTKLDMTMEEESPDYDSKPKAKAPQQCEEKKSEEEGRNTPPRHDVPPSNTISQAALNQLTNYLPQDIEMDTAMIEHLARAAAELQMKRNGRKCTQDGLLNSPPLKPEQVLQYNKTSSSSSPAKKPPPPSSPPPSYHQEGGPAAVAPWSKAEQSKFQEAIQKFGEQEPAKIANYMGTRSEAQIRAHIMNMKASQADQGTQEETPKKHKGRGRKPPTTAMNTVPNANFDVKSMLKNLGNNVI